MFGLFPVLLGLGLTWLYAYIFTVAGVYDGASANTQARPQLACARVLACGTSAPAAWGALRLRVRASMRSGQQHSRHPLPLHPRPPITTTSSYVLQKACTTSQSNFDNIISEAPWIRFPYPGQARPAAPLEITYPCIRMSWAQQRMHHWGGGRADLRCVY